MRYLRVEKTDRRTYFLERHEALDLLSRNYTENVCSFDEMLNTPNEYPCMYCTLIVMDD